MSYTSEALQFLSTSPPATNIEIAAAVKISRLQAQDVIVQLRRTGRCIVHNKRGSGRLATYAITEAGKRALVSGELKSRARPEEVKPKAQVYTIGIVAHAVKTQPVSVWRLAA